MPDLTQEEELARIPGVSLISMELRGHLETLPADIIKTKQTIPPSWSQTYNFVSKTLELPIGYTNFFLLFLHQMININRFQPKANLLPPVCQAMARTAFCCA